MERSICNFCHVRCPVVVEVEDGRVVRLEADGEHPYGGMMCVKGKAAGELVEHPDRLLHPLKQVGPKNGDPKWVRISWDEALVEIAARLLAIRTEHGAETIVFTKGTKSGTGLGDAERWLRRLANCLGTPNIVSTTHLCQWPRDEGTRYTFGVRMPWPDLERSGCLLLWGCNPSTTNIRLAHDIQVARARGMKLITVDPRRVGVAVQADLHLAVQPGTDGALALGIAHALVAQGSFDDPFVRQWTNAPLLVRQDTGQLLRWQDVARDGGPGTDPSGPGARPGEEGTASHLGADQAATSDVGEAGSLGSGSTALQGAVEQAATVYVGWAGKPVRYTPESGKFAVPFEALALEATPTVRLANGTVVQTATVFRLLRDLLDAYPPERAADLTGVPAEQIRAAAELLAAERPLAHYFWNGITQHTNAAQNGRAISVLYALLGDFDAPGGNVLAPRVKTAEVELNDLLDPAQVERRLGWAERPLGAARVGGNSAAYDLYDSVLQGDPYRARALLAFGSNMIMANGGSAEGRAALEQLDLLVVADYFMTPTAQLADYVLPAATFLEAPTLVAGLDYPIPAQSYLQYRAPAVPPRGEAKSDTQMVFDLAVQLSYGDQFWQGDVEAAYAAELEPSGIPLEDLRRHPAGISVLRGALSLGGQAYAQEAGAGFRGFATPTRKVEIFSTSFAAEGQDPLPRYTPPHWSGEEVASAYPLVLSNAKVTQFCHSQHRALPSLRRARPHPQIELHPETAAPLGLANGAWVLVETPEGAMRAQVRLNAAIKPGVVFAQHGWWQDCPELGLPGYAPFAAEGSNANLLVSNRWRDPISGGTPFRSARCRLRKL